MMKDGVIGSGVRTVGKRSLEFDKVKHDEFRRNTAQLAVFAYVLASMDLMLGN